MGPGGAALFLIVSYWSEWLLIVMLDILFLPLRSLAGSLLFAWLNDVLP